MNKKRYKIIITWWYQEEFKHSHTTIYCDEDLLGMILDKYNTFQVKEIEIKEIFEKEDLSLEQRIADEEMYNRFCENYLGRTPTLSNNKDLSIIKKWLEEK